MRPRLALAAVLLVALSACGSKTNTTGLPADDDRALNDAAASLDDNAIAAPSDEGNAQ